MKFVLADVKAFSRGLKENLVIEAPHGALLFSLVLTKLFEIECSKTESTVIIFPLVCAPIPSGIPGMMLPAKRSPAVARTLSETELEEGSKYVGARFAA